MDDDFHPNQSDDRHRCEQCGAMYLVSWSSTEPAIREGSADCDRCHGRMASWSSTRYPIFTLQTDDAPSSG